MEHIFIHTFFSLDILHKTDELYGKEKIDRRDKTKDL